MSKHSRNPTQDGWTINYKKWELVVRQDDRPLDTVLGRDLPQIWVNVYQSMTTYEAEITAITLGDLTYIYDVSFHARFPPRSKGVGPHYEGRLVVVFGYSRKPGEARNCSRQQGYLGKTYEIWGKKANKGHVAPHAAGGILELNLFRIHRALNQRGSKEGREYRDMEDTVINNERTFFFNRLLYKDSDDRPSFIEFGLIPDGKLKIKRFDNHYN